MDRTDHFDSSLKRRYLSRHCKPQEEEPSLQDRIKENSNNFSTYLKKYGDNIRSDKNTVLPVTGNTVSRKTSKEEDEIVTQEAQTESQIIQDINNIEHTLQLMQYDTLDYDVPKQFSFTPPFTPPPSSRL